MELEINEGVTLVYCHDDGSYIVAHSKDEIIGDIMQNFKGFLLAAGFCEKSINEYIALE